MIDLMGLLTSWEFYALLFMISGVFLAAGGNDKFGG